jgi:hypothetical protein
MHNKQILINCIESVPPLKTKQRIALCDRSGPVMGTRFYSKTGKNALILQYGLGYMGFKNDSRKPEPMTISGGTLDFCYDLGYETFLAKGLTLGLQVSYLSGVLTKIKISDGYYTETLELEKENYEGLARVDLMIGLRFSW